MLQFHADVTNKSVLSLRDGHPVGRILSAIINPDNLKVEGFYCTRLRHRDAYILLCQDIREMAPKGYIVNDIEVLTEPHELVRLKRILDADFEPIGKQVRTVSGKKVGKVSEYAVETKTFYIQKLYVSRSLIRSLNGNSFLVIDRSQVNEITDKAIIINDLEGTVPAVEPVPVA